jgi:hypothetical protein
MSRLAAGGDSSPPAASFSALGDPMRAVFVKVQSQYDATRIFTDELAAAFAERGFATTVIDALAEPDLEQAFAREAAVAPTSLVYSVSVLGEWRDARGRSLGDIFGAPHVVQHVDYPLTHVARLEGTSESAALLTIDRTHVAAITSTFGTRRFAHVGFCPHAAVGQPIEHDIEAFAARPIPLLFAGTYHDAAMPPWRAEGGVIEAIFDAALEIALRTEFTPALDAIDQSLRAHGLEPSDPAVAQLRKLSKAVHEQVRWMRRQAFFEAAGAAGLPLSLAGAGFAGRFEPFPSFTPLGEVSLPEVARLMGTSRMVLNINANFGDGSHERPLTAMLAGAAVASDHSAWWGEQFVEDQDVLLYRWRDLDAGLARIAALVEDPEAAWRMAVAGQRRVLAEHRSANRVSVVLAAAQAAQTRRLGLF